MKLFIFFFGIYLFLFCFFSFADEKELKIAVASNFLNTAKIITDSFKNYLNCKIILSSDSSANLYYKIINGANFDIFITADKEHFRMLNYHLKNVHSVLSFSGRLSIFSSNKRFKKNFLIDFSSYKNVSIANKKLAPYGLAAFEVLFNLKIKYVNFVFGNNVNQVFVFVKTGNSELGFVSLSQNISLDAHTMFFIKIPFYLHSSIKQEIFLLNNNVLSVRMADLMSTSYAIDTIRNHGYKI